MRQRGSNLTRLLKRRLFSNGSSSSKDGTTHSTPIMTSSSSRGNNTVVGHQRIKIDSETLTLLRAGNLQEIFQRQIRQVKAVKIPKVSLGQAPEISDDPMPESTLLDGIVKGDNLLNWQVGKNRIIYSCLSPPSSSPSPSSSSSRSSSSSNSSWLLQLYQTLCKSQQNIPIYLASPTKGAVSAALSITDPAADIYESLASFIADSPDPVTVLVDNVKQSDVTGSSSTTTADNRLISTLLMDPKCSNARIWLQGTSIITTTLPLWLHPIPPSSTTDWDPKLPFLNFYSFDGSIWRPLLGKDELKNLLGGSTTPLLSLKDLETPVQYTFLLPLMLPSHAGLLLPHQTAQYLSEMRERIVPASLHGWGDVISSAIPLALQQMHGEPFRAALLDPSSSMQGRAAALKRLVQSLEQHNAKAFSCDPWTQALTLLEMIPFAARCLEPPSSRNSISRIPTLVDDRIVALSIRYGGARPLQLLYLDFTPISPPPSHQEYSNVGNDGDGEEEEDALDSLLPGSAEDSSSIRELFNRIVWDWHEDPSNSSVQHCLAILKYPSMKGGVGIGGDSHHILHVSCLK